MFPVQSGPSKKMRSTIHKSQAKDLQKRKIERLTVEVSSVHCKTECYSV